MIAALLPEIRPCGVLAVHSAGPNFAPCLARFQPQPGGTGPSSRCPAL